MNNSEPREHPLSHHVYGNRSALTVYADTSEQGIPTVSFDATSERQTGPNGKAGWDWGAKLKVQCTKAELPAVAAVLLGLDHSCKFEFHGPRRNKGFSLTLQDDGTIAIRVFQSGEARRMHVIPVSPADAFFVGGVVLTQLRRMLPGVDGAALHALMRRFVGITPPNQKGKSETQRATP